MLRSRSRATRSSFRLSRSGASNEIRARTGRHFGSRAGAFGPGDFLPMRLLAGAGNSWVEAGAGFSWTSNPKDVCPGSRMSFGIRRGCWDSFTPVDSTGITAVRRMPYCTKSPPSPGSKFARMCTFRTKNSHGGRSVGNNDRITTHVPPHTRFPQFSFSTRKVPMPRRRPGPPLSR